MRISEDIGVTVSGCIWECVSEGKCGSCVSGTKGLKAFPGAGAQRVEGEVRNGWNIQGRETGLWLFFISPNLGPPFPSEQSQLCPKEIFAGE